MYSHQITVIFPSTKLISVCSTNIYNNDIVFVSWGLMDNGVFGHQWEWNVHLQSGRQVGQQSFHLYNYPTFKREHSRSIRWGISQVMGQKRCLSGATQSVWKKTVATELSVALGTWVTTVLYSKKKIDVSGDAICERYTVNMKSSWLSNISPVLCRKGKAQISIST